MQRIEIGALTTDETVELAAEAIAYLSEEGIRMLVDKLSATDCENLAYALEERAESA